MMHIIDRNGFRRPTLLAILALLAAGSFSIRSINRNAIFTNDEVRFLGGDSQYHMRRVEIAANNDFQIPMYDPAMNHPQGLYCRWPPLFDQIVAGFAFLLAGGTPTTPTIQTAGAWLPPILGTVTVLCLFFLARIYLTTFAAILACAIMMILPYHVQVSVLGRPDHHVAVVLAGLLLFLSMAAPKRNRNIGTTVFRSFVSGSLLALTLALWIGSLLFVLISVLYFTAIMILSSSDHRALDQQTIDGMGMFGTALVLISPLCKQSHWGRSGELMWTALSHFQILLLFECILGVLSLRLIIELAKPHGQKKARSRLLAGVSLLSLAIVSAFILLDSGFLQQTAGGPDWLFKKDRYLVHIVENMPLTISSAAEDFSFLVFIFPVLVVFLARRTWKQDRHEAAIYMLAWFIVIGGSTLSQERFADLFSISAALLTAYFLTSTTHPDRWPGPLRKHFSASGAARYLLICVMFTILTTASLWPVCRWTFRDYWRAARAPHRSLDVVYDMCHWLRNNTAPSSVSWHKKPSYSVLASWTLGNAITHVGERANVANNIGGYSDTRENNIAPYRFFVSNDIQEAEALLRKYDVRYIVCEEMLQTGYFARILDILDMDQEDFFNSTPGPHGPRNTPKQRFMDSMTTQLYIFNATNFPQFSLVYESPYKINVAGRMMGSYKIFEYKDVQRSTLSNDTTTR